MIFGFIIGVLCGALIQIIPDVVKAIRRKLNEN